MARGPCNSSTSAAGCQYLRINLPQGSFGPMRVIRSFCSWLIMARHLLGSDLEIELWHRACDARRLQLICSSIEHLFNMLTQALAGASGTLRPNPNATTARC